MFMVSVCLGGGRVGSGRRGSLWGELGVVRV